MKKLMSLNLLWLLIASLFFAVSCKDDDEDEPQVLVEDGMYVKGDVTGLPALDPKGLMSAGINEVGQVARSGMYEMYIAIEAGTAGFNIVKKDGSTETVYGPASAEWVEISGNDQPSVTILKGTYAANSAKFTVPTSGLYHIALDQANMAIVIIPVTKWAILGGATDMGWSDTDLPVKGAFSKTAMEFEGTNIVLRSGDFKLRHSGGWKVEISGDSVKCNTNFGGVLNPTTLVPTLVPGGSNYSFPSDTSKHGKYTINVKWQLDGGYSVTFTKTGYIEPLPEYPAELFMIGDGVGGWDWATIDLPMIPVHSHPYMFWKIVWMEATGGFKFAPEKAWGHDFGKTGDASADTVYAKGSDNIPVPGTAGYYMVVVDLKTEQISIADAKVYLIGNCIGSWSAPVAAGLFTVDNANEKLTFTGALADGELRMHAWHKWFPVQTPAADWWQEEFIVLNNVIEFRGAGGDQDRVNITAGTYAIDLNFKTLAGSVTAQ